MKDLVMKDPAKETAPWRYRRMPSCVGELLLIHSVQESLSGLVGIYSESHRWSIETPEEWVEDRALLEPVVVQLEEYFDGGRTEFDLPLAPAGTPFQREVWALLQRIPYGATTTYGEMAAQLGNPNASRAVGAANGRNPISIVIPCHRAIGKNGTLTGYAGGLEMKRKLLDLERRVVGVELDFS